MRRLLIPTLFGITIGFYGCLSSEDVIGPTPIEEEEFAPELEIDLEEMTLNESGLYWVDLAVGEGEEAAIGDTVAFTYTGWLPNGEEIETNEGEDADPMFIVIGMSNVIVGLQEGLIGMQPGGTRLLVIPSHLAWGAMATGPIPANSTVVFRVTLVELNPIDIFEDRALSIDSEIASMEAVQ